MLTAVSAAAAVFAGGSATGSAPLDALLLASLGAATVLAGFQCPSVLILIAALGCSAAGLDSVALPLALAAVGLVLSGLVGQSEPLVDAAAAGLVAQAALRLSTPGGRGQTAVIASVVFLLLLGSAFRTLAPALRRTLIRVAVAAFGFAVLGGITAGVAAALAVEPLRRGLAAATSAIETTQATDDLTATATALTAAGRDFGEARDSLGAWWALPARVVPVVAQHWRVLHSAALTGTELTNAGQRALSAPALTDVHIVDGRVPLEQLAQIEAPVADVAARATAARQRLDGARSTWLVPPLAEKLDTQLVRIREIEKSTGLANRVLPMMPRLLGAEGPRRYFLAVQTPAENRAGGGFMGNYGEITVDDGRLSLSRFGRQADLTDAPGARKLDAPEDFLARYSRFRPEVTWANVNLSPDFPTDAAVIANLYPQSGGAPIDGVIAVDPAGLAALLAVVGPVEVASWPTPINAANALQTLLFDQYQRHDTSAERVDFLGEVAQVAWGRLTSGGLPPVPQLLAEFGPAVKAKHLMFSSTRPDEQRLFVDLGASGRMAPVDGDFVGVVTQNAGGNKIDYYLRRELDYRVRLQPGTGRLEATAKLTLHNDAPTSGAGPTLIGNEVFPPLPIGTNKLYLSFYTPWDLLEGRVNGRPVALEEATELGRRVYSTALEIPSKAAVTIELSLRGRLADDDTYRLDVHQQPVVNPDEVTTTVVVDGETQHIQQWRLESDATLEAPVRRR